MVIGSLWYGPLFGKKWLQLMEFTEEQVKGSFNALKSYGGSYVASLILACILGTIIANINIIGDRNWINGACIGASCWLGFVVTYGFQAVAFESKSWGLYALSLGYNLVVFVVMGTVLGLWGS